jgi:FtsK/SpoIIIE family
MKAILIFLLIILAGVFTLFARDFVSSHGLSRIIVRFASGHALNGEHHTDAGFFRRGVRIRHPSGHASNWSHMPHATRAVIRWTALIALIAAAYGLFTDRSVTLIALVAGIALGIGLVSARARKVIRAHHHVRSMHSPLSVALSPLLGVTPNVVSDSLDIRRDYASAKSNEMIGSLVLPGHWAANPAERESAEHLIQSRLGVECMFDWQVDKHPMMLSIRRAPIPPKLVKLSDMLPVIHALEPGHILLGVTGRGERIGWDLNSEEPHLMVQATSRRGKTRLLLLIVCQMLFQGAEHIIALDPKRVGLDNVLTGIPGVEIHSHPKRVDQMWAGIRKMRVIMDDRIDQLAEDRTLDGSFRKALLVIDEVSMFSAMSKLYWDETRDPKTTKATPVIWQDVAAIVWEGAQVGVHCLVFGQRLESSTLGGMLESFGTRLLAGYTKRGYDRLVGITPMPPSQKPRGRFLYFDGETLTFIQTILGQDDELRELAQNQHTLVEAS